MNRIAIAACLAIFFVASLGATGCRTMSRGRTQTIAVTSTPPGAKIAVEPGSLNREIKTPGAIVLSRKQTQIVYLKKDGYEEASVILESSSSGLWRNVIWIHPVGWIIGVIIDLSTGSAYALEPDSIEMTLTRLPEQSPPVATGP